MTKHKHAEMIKAKADNMELCMFIKEYCGWVKNTDIFPVEGYPLTEDKEYFLFLPQHKEACLHWLNGGGVEFHGDSGWIPCGTYRTTQEWLPDVWMMCPENTYRVKPRREIPNIIDEYTGYPCIVVPTSLDLRMIYTGGRVTFEQYNYLMWIDGVFSEETRVTYRQHVYNEYQYVRYVIDKYFDTTTFELKGK